MKSSIVPIAVICIVLAGIVAQMVNFHTYSSNMKKIEQDYTHGCNERDSIRHIQDSIRWEMHCRELDEIHSRY